MPEPSRAGEDTRRRGWFWHWNTIVTQYAPLIGLEGCRAAQLLHGLDRPAGRIAPPRLRLPLAAERGRLLRRGPRRADHHQQDPGRARPDRDPQGDGGPRRCQGSPLEGAAQPLPGQGPRRRLLPRPADVLRVAELADRDRAVYRYVRRIFSPRFAPIDGDNVWGRILPQVRLNPVWQGLAARRPPKRIELPHGLGPATPRGRASPSKQSRLLNPLPVRHFLRPMPVTERQSSPVSMTA